MSVKVERKTDSYLKDTVQKLLERSRESGSAFWRDIAIRLSSSRKNYATVNLGKLQAITSDDDVIVIPGYLLSSGIFNKKIKVSAFKVSEKALKKLNDAGSEFISLLDLASENPKGTNIKIIR